MGHKLAWLLVLVLCLPLRAAVVTRPLKTCGTTNYVAEVAAGCLVIKNSEVDADINAILTGGVNNIETANINASGLGTAAIANQAITTGKIADAPNGVSTVKLNDNAVTTVKITDANVTTPKIADLNVTTAKINDLAVTTAKINDLGVTTAKLNTDSVTTAKILDANVTKAKLAIGATVFVQASPAVTTSLAFSTVETTIWSSGSITFRGSYVLISGFWGVFCNNQGGGAGGDAVVTIRIKRDGTTLATGGTVTFNCGSTAVSTTDIPLPTPFIVDVNPSAGAHTYTITGQTAGAGVTLNTTAANAGVINALELD